MKTCAALTIIILAHLAGPLSAAAPPAPAGGVAGEWTLTVDLAGQSREYLLELKQEGEAVKGSLVSPRSGNRYPIQSGSFKDPVLKMDIPREYFGRDVILKVVAKLEGEKGDRLDGTFDVEGLGSGKFAAVRKGGAPGAAVAPKAARPSLAGRWTTLAQVGDRDLEGQVEIQEKGGKLSGVLAGQSGPIDLKAVHQAEDGQVTIALVLPIQGEDREFIIKAGFDGADRLKGRWASVEGDASGDWTARREAPPPPPAPAAPAAAPFAGRFHAVATLPEGKTVALDIRFRFEGGKIAGHLETDTGKKGEILSGTFQEGKLEMEVQVDEEGEKLRVKMTATLGEKGVLQGAWSTDNASGEWTARPVEEL